MEFVCQNHRCRKVLDLDESLVNFDIQLLQKEDVQEIEDKLKEFDKALNSPPTKSTIASKLFEIASDVTGMDHPLCKECTQKTLKSLETQLAEATKENSAYKMFLKKLKGENEKYPLESQLDEEIIKVEEEEAELRERLRKIAEERKLLKLEMQRLDVQSEKIKSIEERYWRNFDEFQNELEAFQEEYDTVKVRLTNAKERLENLKITNVYNDTFHIWHDGHFGTINNFRLGRLPSQPVDWNEINAAWGQATLLLHTIAKKLNYKFSTYRLLPMGSNSKMEKISDKSTYELYGSSDISLGRLFWYRRFDTGMAAFLGCLKELGDLAESKDKNFRLHYRIDKDKIGDMSIRIQFNNEETWTKALKYMLTNLKYLLVWLAKQSK